MADPLRGQTRYQKLRDLGQGAFGIVQLATDLKNNEQVAIKFVQRGPSITKYVAREILNHSRLLHPHIVQFKEVFLTPTHLCIVMEFAAGGDMFHHVKRSGGLDEEDVRWFYQQLVIALHYMHELGVVNRDIKLENTLLDGSKRPLLKICDFGYSKSDNDSMPKSKVGTPGYTAPEVLANSRHYDGQKCDVWSSGVMLYVMLYCEYPFERPEDDNDPHRFRKSLERTQNLDYRFPDTVRVSAGCKDLIRRILVLDPKMRPSIQEIQAHPWYSHGLPAGVLNMNADCLKLRNFTAGHQTEAEIRDVIVQAMGSGRSNRRRQDSLLQDTMDEEMAALA